MFFATDDGRVVPDGGTYCRPNGGFCGPTGTICDPQIGCSNRLTAEDLSDEHSWQLSQEFRLASNFSGPLNFSAGGNYLHYETVEDYYVFINTLTTALASPAWAAVSWTVLHMFPAFRTILIAFLMAL